MGIVRLCEKQEVEIEEFRRMLLSYAGGVQTRKHQVEFRDQPVTAALGGNDGVAEEKLVCVTSGVSFLGLAIVNRLLIRGYSVRIVVTNEEDMEKLREMELSGEMIGANNRVIAVMADLTDVHNLSQAFDGCRGVFHTAAFVDPAGLSGYSKSMVDVEVKTSENVMEACSGTSSVRNCVLTSSLLACIWRDNSQSDVSSIVDHNSWSDESICVDKKLWYALGKLRAEKAARRKAEQRGLKLVTICPGLITGPEFCHRNPTATIAYLKGAQEMYAYGLLATVDVNRLAEAHVCAFEEMGKTAFGRYVCFDRVIQSEDEAEELAREMGMQTNMISGNSSGSSSFRFELSNVKLSRLMTRTLRCINEC